MSQLRIRSNARYILVVEKDAVFNRLLQEKACERMHAIMVTARGMPDIATRALLQRLTQELPHTPVVGLFDWNPSGAVILCTYRGLQSKKARTAVEQQCVAIGANVRWICALSGDLTSRPDDELLPLTPRDLVLLRNLQARMTGLNEDVPWATSLLGELAAMARRGRKAELEALYSAGEDLTPLLAQKIVRQAWI